MNTFIKTDNAWEKLAMPQILACLLGLALCGTVHARTWSFESALTGLSPISALGSSPVTLDGDFDFSFDTLAGEFKVSSINTTVANTSIGTFSDFNFAQLTTTGADRVFFFSGAVSSFQVSLNFHINEGLLTNRLDDSNPTNTVDLADRPGGFIGGVMIPGPHDVLLQIKDFSAGFSVPPTVSNSVFTNVQLKDPALGAAVVPLPESLPILAAALALLGILAGRRHRQRARQFSAL